MKTYTNAKRKEKKTRKKWTFQDIITSSDESTQIKRNEETKIIENLRSYK